METKVPQQRTLSYCRWREYVKALFPGLHLSRPKVDLCDRCVRIETELMMPDLTDERREFLKKEQTMHLEEAMSQRRI